jgi:hypothetical protein
MIPPAAVGSAILAAGSPPISTLDAPGGMIGVGTPDVAVLTIRSVMRAAGSIEPPIQNRLREGREAGAKNTKKAFGLNLQAFAFLRVLCGYSAFFA